MRGTFSKESLGKDSGIEYYEEDGRFYAEIQPDLRALCGQSICKQRSIFLKRLAAELVADIDFEIAKSSDLMAVFTTRECKAIKFFVTRRMMYDFIVEESKIEDPIGFRPDPEGDKTPRYVVMTTPMIFNITCSTKRCQELTLIMRRIRDNLTDTPDVPLDYINDIASFLRQGVEPVSSEKVRVALTKKMAMDWLAEADDHDFCFQDDLREDLIPELVDLAIPERARNTVVDKLIETNTYKPDWKKIFETFPEFEKLVE